MSNLAPKADKATPETNQGNNSGVGGGGGGFAPFSRLLKWWRHSSASRDSAPASSAQRNVGDTPEVCKESSIQPTVSTQQQSKNKNFLGNLGIGEYVAEMGGGFEEPDNNSPVGQKKFRSLIDISMSNLWVLDGAENGGAARDTAEAEPSPSPHSSGANSRKVSSSSPDKWPMSVLATIKRLVPNPPSPPNLVQFMDSPRTSAKLYENLETAFFRNQTEDRWTTPAYLITNCGQFQRGDMFNASRIFFFFFFRHFDSAGN